jgi:hypothetical protein
MSNIHEQPNSRNSRLERSRSNFDSSYVLGSSRPSPFVSAEQVKRDFSLRLDQLLEELEIELSIALNIDPLSLPLGHARNVACDFAKFIGCGALYHVAVETLVSSSARQQTPR